ncbi:MAG: DNA repair protein [Nitrosarchaeum sp.]|nr:MAG: DNA repair protein [Nitrosarchaeum sp.]
MGLFGKKKEQADERISEKSEEVVLKEALETEVENLQKEFRAKQEEIENITEKLHKVKEEYDVATSNLMSVKKESNQKKMELDTIYLEYKNVKSKISNADEKLNKNKKSYDELDKVESNLTKMRHDLEKITKEYDGIKEKITEEQSTLHKIQTQQSQAQKELEEITSRLYNAKNLQDNNEASVFTLKERESIDETRDKRETKGIIEAASVVVGSLKSKLSMTEKELETVQTLLEKERNEHIQTKNELEKLKRKSDSNQSR